MIVFIISIIVAIICYVIGKKRAVLKNNFIILRNILWVEACVFMAGYFFTDQEIYRRIWMIFMGTAGIFSLVYSCFLKKKDSVK